MAFPVSAVIGGVSDIAKTALGSAFSNSQWNKQKQFLLEQREYNSPKNQVVRLREAGLNPSLVLANGGASAAGNVNQSAPSSAQPDFSFNQAMQGYQQDRIAQAQINLLKSETRKNNAEAGISEVDVRSREDMNKQALAKMLAETDWTKTQDSLGKEKQKMAERHNEIEELNYNNLVNLPLVNLERMVAERDSVILQNEYQRIFNRFASAELLSDVAQKLASAQSAMASAGLSRAEAAFVLNQNEDFVKLMKEKDKQGYYARFVAAELLGYESEAEMKKNSSEGLTSARLRMRNNNLDNVGDYVSYFVDAVQVLCESLSPLVNGIVGFAVGKGLQPKAVQWKPVTGFSSSKSVRGFGN